MKHSNKVACFGELLLRFSPDAEGIWVKQQQMPVYVGGAELNVASALGAWGIPVKFITALPDNGLRNALEEELIARNVELRGLFLPGTRIGTYYLPTGAELKSAGVIYDRAHSAFASLKPSMLDWEKLFSDVNWFHISAIDPALTSDLADVCVEALTVARSMGITISIDLNYRAKLWQYGTAPAEIMPRLLPYADLIMGNIWAVESLIGIRSEVASSDGLSDALLIAAAQKSMQALQTSYLNASKIVYTFRLADRYFSVGQNEIEQFTSRVYPIKDVVDRAGSGDCFMAALIYGSLNGLTFQQQLDMGGAAAVQKMQERGDATKQTLESLMKKISL